MHQDLIPEIKRRNPILEVAAELGVEVDRSNVAHCFRPERHKHGDRSPSLAFFPQADPEKDRFKCFVCDDVGGDVIDLVEQRNGFGKKEAIEFLKKRIGIVDITPRVLSLDQKVAKVQQKLRQNKEGQEYLKSRGFREETIEKLKIGFDDGTIFGRRFKNMIVFPYLNSGKATYIKGSAIEKDADGKRHHENIGGTIPGLYNETALKDTREVFLCEGETDTITLAQEGFASVGAPGVQGFKRQWTQKLKGKKVFIVWDNDGPGTEEARRLSNLLMEEGIERYLLSLPEGIKDVNDLYLKDKDEFPKVISSLVTEALRKKTTDCSRLNVDIETVRETIESHYRILWPSVEACLSCIATLRLKDLEHPVSLNLVGDPSSGKSLEVSWIAGNKEHVYRTDHFTPKAIVSHAANIKEKDRAKVHMLPKIKDKVIAISELAPMFRGRADDIRDNCIRLIRLLDGEGWIGDSGAAGRQGFEEEHLFCWIGCTTPLEYKIWDIFGQLGPRLWFHWIPKDEKTPEQRHAEACSGLTPKEKNKRCRDAVTQFINDLLGGGRYDIGWDIRSDPKEVCITIQKFAELVAHARGLVRVAVDRYRESLQLEHSTPIVEAPYRAYNVLTSIARGHAILYGRKMLSIDDLGVIKRTAMSTMPDDRRIILPKLIENNGRLTSDEISEVLRCSKPKALISMEAMSAVGLVRINEGDGSVPNEIVLEDKFQWLLTEEFASISVNGFDTVRVKNACFPR